MLTLSLAWAAAALAAPAPARAAEPRATLTIYSHDLAFVRERRTLQTTGSRDTLRLLDVPDRIDVASVSLEPEAGRVTRLAYRADAASGDALLERSRGARVHVAMRGDRVVDGTLLSSDASWLVVREADGAVRTLSRAAVEDARILDSPARLSARPALEAVVEGGHRGSTPARLSYLTGGLSWTAEHRLVRSGETSGSWSSSVAVDNQSGVDFSDVALSLVAGDPSLQGPMPMPLRGRMQVLAAGIQAEEKAADLGEESFSEYHLYRLDRPASLRDQETQQLSMLEPRNVKLTPRYLFRGTEGRGVRAQLEIVNRDASGLGVPLAAGRVRVYEPDASGEVRFTGEASIAHTAEGETLTVDVGRAFDLVGERREMSSRRISDREREYSVEIKLRNHKKAGVTIIAEESVSGDVEILQKSHEFVRKDANTIQFRVPVAAGKEVAVTYTARVRY